MLSICIVRILSFLLLEVLISQPTLRNGWKLPYTDFDEVELVLPVSSPKSRNVGLPNELSIELPERLSIRLSKELSKGLSETAATIFRLIYADNYITRGDIAKKVGVSVTAVQKHVNKLKSIRLLDGEGSASHGHWIIIDN